MESLIITITSALLIFNFFPVKKAEINLISNKNSFAEHLSPAKNVEYPYRPKGVTLYDKNNLTAANAVLVDEKSGKVLFEKDSYEKKSIASLTKLMSALVWMEQDGDLAKTVEIKADDYRTGGIAYFLTGEKVKTKDLLYTGLIASSNSAVASLVRSTGLSEQDFVSLMNEKAKNLGMENTRFAEPTGLDYHNISTAADLYILAKAAFENKEIKNATETKTYQFSPIGKNMTRTIRNTDWLLSSTLNSGKYEILGGKTGYIEESNYNLIIKIQQKEKNGTVIAVVLGSKDKESRFTEGKNLVEWAFNNHVWSN